MSSSAARTSAISAGIPVRGASCRDRYIASLADAKAYLAHPVLGERLRRCTAAVHAVQNRSAHDIFGSPDDLKFHSSLTLFQLASNDEPVFARALAAYFGGRKEEATVAILQAKAD